MSKILVFDDFVAFLLPWLKLVPKGDCQESVHGGFIEADIGREKVTNIKMKNNQRTLDEYVGSLSKV